MKLFFNFESNQLTNASTIIFFDSSIYYYFCAYIQKHYSGKKLIFYYWNTINRKKERQILHFKYFYDIYSFSLNDCAKYNLKYNKLFFPIQNYFLGQVQNIRQDVFFVGKNKGRISQILKIVKEFENLDISYKIICTHINKKLSRNIHTNPIPYEEVLTEDMSSKAILDINNNDEYGMTMRELEALFLKKKLITNNIAAKERDYYHKNNVFIIDYTTISPFEGLKEFLEIPFVSIDDKIIKSYSVESWIQRFNDSLNT
jgi:hypothetical protein